MATARDELMLKLLQACAERAPLYPAQYAKDNGLERDTVDAALDELRYRGLVQFTDWVKDLGQGRALTDAGKQALATKDLHALTPEVTREPASISLYERGEIVRRAIYDSSSPYVSWTLLALNVFVFFLGAIYAGIADYDVRAYLLGDTADEYRIGSVLRDLGGLNYEDIRRKVPTRRPQFERLIIGCFLHVGILHLGLNMFFLGSLAGLVEAMWGRLRYVAIYAIAGLVSGCVILLLDSSRDERERIIVTVGASGPLFGVFAALLVWFVLNYQHLPEDALQEYARMLSFNLMLMVAVNFVGGVSWQGHLGGAIGGLLAALLLHIQRFHPERWARVLALLALPLIPAGFFLAVLWQAGWL